MNISIVLCCYNSTSRIKKTLSSLYDAIINYPFDVEVILIDNNSTDNTKDIAIDFWKEINNNNIPLMIFFEEKPGLANARYHGVMKSKHDVILFCDDDNWLQAEYIHSLPKILSNDSIGAVGGRGIPFSNIPIPDWFFEHLDAYACSTQKSHLYGASLVIRKEIIKDFYNSPISKSLVGRTGNNLDSGEDNLLGEYIKEKGYSLYSNNIPFIHFMSENRLSFTYLYKLSFHFGKATRTIHEGKNKNHINYIVRKIIKETFSLIFIKKYKKIKLLRDWYFIKGYFSKK